MPSAEGFNRARPCAGLEEFPIPPELLLMKLGPCLDEPPLLLREGSRNDLNWVDPEHGYPVLEVRMEVRDLVRSASLCEHPDDDPEEARDLWHTSILWFSSPSQGVHAPPDGAAQPQSPCRCGPTYGSLLPHGPPHLWSI